MAVSLLIEKNSHTIYFDHGSPLLIPSFCSPTQHHILPLEVSLENKQANKQTKVDFKKLRKHIHKNENQSERQYLKDIYL